MPAQIERREPGVYLVNWEGAITRDELLDFIRMRDQQVEQGGDLRYVMIADVTKASMREYDIRTTRRAIEDPRLEAVYVINPSMVMQTLIQLLRQITKITIDICASYDEALTRAHEALTR
jgi:alkyl hydroperoxide reductase subunit AhpC